MPCQKIVFAFIQYIKRTGHTFSVHLPCVMNVFTAKEKTTNNCAVFKKVN
jgi:hypothetical protein